MGSYTESVRSAVEQAIEASGIPLANIAASAHIPRSTLQRRMAGAQPFTIKELDGLATALGVPVRDLLPQEAA